MNLFAQHILMNWIGMVAVLFDSFPINGSAEKLSGNPILLKNSSEETERKWSNSSEGPILLKVQFF